jgi:hypothetical protein
MTSDYWKFVSTNAFVPMANTVVCLLSYNSLIDAYILTSPIASYIQSGVPNYFEFAKQ